jgi:hypothetical protein
MRANVYFPYTLLSRWGRAVYGAFRKWRDSNNLTDGVGFEPTVRYERTHTFQASLVNAANEHRRSVPVVTSTLLRSLRSETRPKTPTQRIQTVYSALLEDGCVNPPSIYDQPLRLLMPIWGWL